MIQIRVQVYSYYFDVWIVIYNARQYLILGIIRSMYSYSYRGGFEF